MSAELIEKTREHVAALEAELEKWRTVLTLLGEEKGPAIKKKAKPRKEGKAAKPARPTSAAQGGQPELGKRAQKRAAKLEKIRAMLEKNPDLRPGQIVAKLGGQHQSARELLQEAKGA